MTDTSQLVIDAGDIFRTNKVACILKYGQMYDLVVGSPNNRNLLWKIFHEKTKIRSDMKKENEIFPDGRCLVGLIGFKILEIISSKVFFVGDRRLADFFLSGTFFIEGSIKKIWISEKLYEYPQVIYYAAGKSMIGKM